MKRVLLVSGVVLIASAYVAGFWPERRRVQDLLTQTKLLEQRLAVAESRVRLGEVLGDLLALEDAIEARNYAEAAAQASRYFDRLGAEALRAERPEVKQTLETTLQARDAVTAGLARTEPAVLEVLRQQELALRRALAYPVGQ